MHASEFSSHDISFYTYWAFLKTGLNVRNLPPAHSRGAVTFSGLWEWETYTRRVSSRRAPRCSLTALADMWRGATETEIGAALCAIGAGRTF